MYLCNMETTPHTVTRRKERMSYEQAFSMNGGNKPPQAVELEEAVLGALMLDLNALNTAIEMLHEEYFYKPEHRVIFRAIFNRGLWLRRYIRTTIIGTLSKYTIIVTREDLPYIREK